MNPSFGAYDGFTRTESHDRSDPHMGRFLEKLRSLDRA